MNRNYYMTSEEQKKDTVLQCVCSLTNMKLGSAGFTNLYNEMAKAGKFNDCETVGDIAIAMLEYRLAELKANK